MSQHDTSAQSRPFHPGTQWHLFNFEGEGVGTPAPAPADPASASDPGTAAGVAPPEPSAAAQPAAAPTGGPGTPEFDAAVDMAIAERLAALRAGYQEPQQQPAYQLPQLDPFADNFGQELVGTLAQLLDGALEQRLGPITASHEEQQIAQGTAQSYETFKSFADLGEFDHEQAFTRAQDIFGRYLQTYGERYAEAFTGRALREAAEQQARYERAVEQRGVERYKQELAGAVSRPNGDLGVGGGGARVPEQANTYDDVIARWEARRHAPAAQV